MIMTTIEEEAMKSRHLIGLRATALLYLISSAAMAQNAPPSYEGDPDVYKVIFEDQNFRVIDSVRKKGVHDKLHSHPVPSIVYYPTECTSVVYGPDGKPTGSPSVVKAGTARAVPITPGHSVENVGPEDCHALFVERK
jgi:hypothetical protein